MDAQFQPAEAALARGNVAELQAILASAPQLARTRSDCSHPTLLQALVLAMPPVPTLLELIDLLVTHGAEFSEPLIAACGVDNVIAVQRLIELGAQLTRHNAWSPLEEALYWGNPATVELLLRHAAPIANLRTAAALGDMKFLAGCFDAAGELTPAAGVVDWPFTSMRIPDSQRTDRQQIVDNALIYAAAWGQFAAVDFLVDRGANVNAIPAGFDFAGTPVHYAALRGRRDMIDYLLALGADPAIVDTKIGKRAEDWACHDGHEALANYLAGVRTARQ